MRTGAVDGRQLFLGGLDVDYVGVVSVSEPSLDYSTPRGFLFLSILRALVEWYSRNLSSETRKGWAERKRRQRLARACGYVTDT